MEREIVVYKTEDCGACKMMQEMWGQVETDVKITWIVVNDTNRPKPKEMRGAPYIVVKVNGDIIFTDTGFVQLENVLEVIKRKEQI